VVNDFRADALTYPGAFLRRVSCAHPSTRHRSPPLAMVAKPSARRCSRCRWRTGNGATCADGRTQETRKGHFSIGKPMQCARVFPLIPGRFASSVFTMQ
jgi:hypothetical protein